MQTAPPKGKPSDRLAAVLLNYRTPTETLRAIESLLGSDRPIDEIIVVDNDATTSCPVELTHLAGRFTYLATGSNLGFSGGVNAGIRVALRRGARSVLIVNSDVVVMPDTISHLENALDRHTDAGIAGPVVVPASDPSRVASLGIRYELTTGRMRHRAVGANIAQIRSDECDVVDGVAGCLMLIKRSVLDAVGLFDERFFYSFEDLDLCLRARRAGYRTIVVRHATAIHEGGRTIGPDSPRRLYFASRNHLLLSQKVRGNTGTLASTSQASVILFLNIAHALTARGGSIGSRLHAVMAGALDYSKGCFGSDKLE